MKIYIIPIVALILSLSAVPARAFTPDDVELSAAMHRQYGALTSWEAEMSFPEYPGVTAHLWYAKGRWRQEWKAGDSALAVGMNGNVVATCTAESFALSPLFVWMVPDPLEAWKSWGVDNATASYGFCDGQPCYMLGAEPGDEATPVVMLNNEDMSPLLIRYVEGEISTTLTYSDYRTLGGFRVPEKMVATMGAVVLEGSVKWIAINRADGQELYARDGLDGVPCATPPVPFTILRDNFRYPTAK